MQQFLTLIKKELQIYFSGASSYFVIFVYLCASFGGAFYFGGYLAEKDSSLHSLFALQPYILIMLVPAVTMRLWAEEYKTNTAEFLLTLPLNPLKIISAKFCFSSGFFIILSLGLLPFILYTASLQNLDWLNIFSSYIGLWALIILLCAFGCFISSLSKNLIIAYVLNLFILVPCVTIATTYLISTYNNFLFAEVGLPDLFYFISFAVLFLLLNLSILKHKRNKQKNSITGLIIVVASAIFANIFLFGVLSRIDYKFDLTSNNLFSLKTQTKQIIKQIKTPTQIDLFIAEDFYNYDTTVAHYFEQVSRFLYKYQQESTGMIQFSALKVPAFSSKEDELAAFGFYTTKGTSGSKNYFGAVIKNQENEIQIIKQFLPQRQAYLEEDVDRALLKISFPDLKKNIGVYFDPEQNLDDYEAIGLILENEYNIGLLDNKTYQIRNTTDAVILFNPKSLSSVFIYALDQYVMHGGKLVLFLDRQTTNQFDKVNDESIALMRLLNHWNIELGGEPFDEGKAVEFLSESSLPLLLHTAYGIKTINENLTVKPLIINGEIILGARLSGKLSSYYHYNPFTETPIGELMHSFKSQTDSADIIIIGDADILDENNWIDKSSPDRDIFGAIEKAGNGRFLRYLIDDVVDNELYLKLPQNKTDQNLSSLAEKIKNRINSIDEQRYEEIKTEANELATQIWIMSDYEAGNVSKFLNMTEEGRKIQSLVEEKNEIEYQRIAKYNRFTRNLMIFFIGILPLIESFLAFIAFYIWMRRRKTHLKELLK